MTSDLTKLERAAADAEIKAARAREVAVKATAHAAEQREARLVEYDKTRLGAFNEAPLEADWRKAEADFRAAVLADPVHQAWIHYQIAALRRTYRAIEAAGDAARLGVHKQIRQASPPGNPEFIDIARVISDEASRLAHEEQTARGEARIDAGDRAAR